MPPVVAVLHHLEQPFLGMAERPLREAGLEIDECFLARGDELPALGEVDAIISMGGAQSMVAPDELLQAEAELLADAVRMGVPVLGVCLGAQVLAAACGATVRNAGRAVGWRELTVAEADALTRSLSSPVPALHWNEDVFDLPPGAVEIFDRPGEGVEGFRMGESAWGVQFHPDVDRDALAGWYADYGDWVRDAGVSVGEAQTSDERHWSAHESASPAIFAAFAAVVPQR